MALFKLTAGSEIDLITKEEVKDLLQQWRIDSAVSARPVTISASGVPTPEGLAVIGGDRPLTGGALGPRPAYFWAVMRLAVRIDSQPAAFEVYVDRRSPQQLVRDVDGTANGYVAFGTQELIVLGGSNLCIAAGAADPTQQIFVSGQAIEVPMIHMHRILGGR